MPISPSPGAALDLTGVCKRYGSSREQRITAAHEVSLTIEPGSVIALTGPSGSGKSTLLHLVGAIERPDSGTITSDGTELTALHGAALAAYRRTVGFVFQRYNLLPALTALDNVIAPVLPYRTGWDKPDRGRQLLAAVGLAGRERSLPSRMSGGEQQRVAMARALVNTPSLLLADEPTGNLDSQNASEILDLLLRLRESKPDDDHHRHARRAGRFPVRAHHPAAGRGRRRRPRPPGRLPGRGGSPPGQPARLTGPARKRPPGGCPAASAGPPTCCTCRSRTPPAGSPRPGSARTRSCQARRRRSPGRPMTWRPPSARPGLPGTAACRCRPG